MEDIQKTLRDLRYLNWARTRKSSGTAGSFLKSYDDTGKRKKYYKLSDYDPMRGIIGHECVNEIVVQRLLRLLHIDHLEYTLIHALVRIEEKEYETWLCESEDYKRETEGKLALEDYYQAERTEGESPFDFFVRMGWEQYLYEMLLTDYLVLNRDRHGANIEVLRDVKSRQVRLAPLFDHGLSLLCRCHTEEELEKYDVMEDKRVQSFVGSSSALENVKMVPRDFLERYSGLEMQELDQITEGMEDILGKPHMEKICGMIRERWCSLDHI